MVLGVAVIGGSLYWLYGSTQGLWVAPIIDPENPEGWELGEEMAVAAEDLQEAERLCRQAGKRHGKQLENVEPRGEFNGVNTYVCKFS